MPRRFVESGGVVKILVAHFFPSIDGVPAAMFKNNEAIERSYERMREEIKRVESSGLEIDVK